MLACAALLAAAPAVAAPPVDGAAVYQKRCASCHGADGRGNARNPPVVGKATLVKEVMELHPPPMERIQLRAGETEAVTAFVAGLKK